MATFLRRGVKMKIKKGLKVMGASYIAGVLVVLGIIYFMLGDVFNSIIWFLISLGLLTYSLVNATGEKNV